LLGPALNLQLQIFETRLKSLKCRRHPQDTWADAPCRLRQHSSCYGASQMSNDRAACFTLELDHRRMWSSHAHRSWNPLRQRNCLWSIGVWP